MTSRVSFHPKIAFLLRKEIPCISCKSEAPRALSGVGSTPARAANPGACGRSGKGPRPPRALGGPWLTCAQLLPGRREGRAWAPSAPRFLRSGLVLRRLVVQGRSLSVEPVNEHSGVVVVGAGEWTRWGHGHGSRWMNTADACGFSWGRRSDSWRGSQTRGEPQPPHLSTCLKDVTWSVWLFFNSFLST